MPTNPIYEKRARRFFITLNDITKYEQLKEYITKKKNFKAMASCLAKAPTTGHEHIHIAVWFKQPFKWKQQVGERIEEMKSQTGSLEYVSPEKQEGWVKYLDKIGIDKLRDKKRTCEEIMKMTPQEARKVLTLSQMVSYQKLKQYDDPITVEEMYKPEVEVYFLYGPSKAGKSKYVYDKLIEKGYGKQAIDRIKYVSSFYIGQIGVNREVCWLEEFRDSQMPASEFINFIDYYVNPMNIKGGSLMNRYKLIFITSVQDPHEIYKNMDEEPRRQWTRRLHMVPFLGNN